MHLLSMLRPSEEISMKSRIRRLPTVPDRLARGLLDRPGALTPGRRFADLLIAATALAEDLPLVTRKSKDFQGLEGLVTVVEI
jgi:predicted nucleic acid-binding protein